MDRTARLRQTTYSPTVRIKVLRQAAGGLVVACSVSVEPEGLSTRPAKSGECEVSIWDGGPGGLWYSEWTAWYPTDSAGKVTFGEYNYENSWYAVYARHIASGATYRKQFKVTDNQVVQENSQELVESGSEMPATFQQSRPARGLAFPEVRQWTRIGSNPALPGTVIRVRQQSGGPGYREPLV